jgi:molybdopterin synthase catalytic subunit
VSATPLPNESLVAIAAEPIDVDAYERFVARPDAGAVVLFRGVVRNLDGGRPVVRLEYEAHPTADDVLRGIAEEFAADDDVLALAVAHRTGTLEVGEVALVAAVAAAHRREAFDICARLVDEVKHRLPIWKRQLFADGSDEWVNCP